MESSALSVWNSSVRVFSPRSVVESPSSSIFFTLSLSALSNVIAFMFSPNCDARGPPVEGRIPAQRAFAGGVPSGVGRARCVRMLCGQEADTVRFIRDQGLALAMFGIFAVTIVGLAVAGWGDYNADQAEHGGATVSLVGYLGTSAFGEAVFENWESEFLQMGF